MSDQVVIIDTAILALGDIAVDLQDAGLTRRWDDVDSKIQGAITRLRVLRTGLEQETNG